MPRFVLGRRLVQPRVLLAPRLAWPPRSPLEALNRRGSISANQVGRSWGASRRSCGLWRRRMWVRLIFATKKIIDLCARRDDGYAFDVGIAELSSTDSVLSADVLETLQLTL